MPLSPAIRLVKGAYREPPEVAFPRKQDTDDNYFALNDRMLSAAATGGAFPVFGTHDLALLRLDRTADALDAGIPLIAGGIPIRLAEPDDLKLAPKKTVA